jgi:hypothetical protein
MKYYNWYSTHSPLNKIPALRVGITMFLSADFNFRCCKPDLAAWLAECPEDSDQHHLVRYGSVWCMCPKHELGDDMPSDKQHPRWDPNQYRTLRNANTKAADAELSSRGVDAEFHVFRHISCIVSDLPKPDLLHTMQIGMLDHLQKWIFHFIKTHEWLDK